MRQVRVIALLGFLTIIGCGDSKTQIPTKQQEMPKVAPVGGGGGGGGGDKGAPTSKAS